MNINGEYYEVIPYDNLPSNAIKNTEEGYIPGESKEISLISILVTIIIILFVIYFLIWGIYNYIYRRITFYNINLSE